MTPQISSQFHAHLYSQGGSNQNIKKFQFLVIVTKSKCLRHVMNIWVRRFLSLSQFLELQLSEVGGGKRSGAETPTGNPSPAPSASAPHARHDRSMARSSSDSRVIRGQLSDSPPYSQKNVASGRRASVFISFILARNYNGFAEDQLSL